MERFIHGPAGKGQIQECDAVKFKTFSFPKMAQDHVLPFFLNLKS